MEQVGRRMPVSVHTKDLSKYIIFCAHCASRWDSIFRVVLSLWRPIGGVAPGQAAAVTCKDKGL